MPKAHRKWIFATIAALVMGSGVVIADEKGLMELNPDNFDSNSINIDNPWLPMQPGMLYIYEGHTDEEGKKVPHRAVFYITDLIKVINNVRVVVIYERDFSDNSLEEAELTFFAQDKEGNVWHLGQLSEVFDEVELVGYRAWMDGSVEGAHSGIMMKAEPKLNTPSYSQGYAPAPYNWSDRARTHKMGEKVTVPFGHYDNVLVTEEFSDEEPDAFQLKYYAKDVGLIRVGWSGDDPQQEELELINIKKLSPQEMAELRAEALKIEERAYVYANTKPVTMRDGAEVGHSSGTDNLHH